MGGSICFANFNNACLLYVTKARKRLYQFERACVHSITRDETRVSGAFVFLRLLYEGMDEERGHEMNWMGGKEQRLG